ncbi:MAG: PilN domain-containing protein, partial [Methylococcales bacterium]
AGVKLILQKQIDQLQTEVQILETGKKFKLEQQQKFNDLLAKERLLNKRLIILDNLRGGLSAKSLLLVVDRVLDGDVWFTKWTLTRATEQDNVKTLGASVTAAVNPVGASDGQAWQLNTRMEITGQALDHSKLAAFVNRLMLQPEIKDVKVLNTAQKTYLSTQVIDFSLVVTTNNQPYPKHD